MGGWTRVVEGFAPKIVDECRAGILVGSRLAAAGLLADARFFVLPHYD